MVSFLDVIPRATAITFQVNKFHTNPKDTLIVKYYSLILSNISLNHLKMLKKEKETILSLIFVLL